jgi:hypothetical protein
LRLPHKPHPAASARISARIDERQRAVALEVPEGPAIAGLQALGQCADAVDRTDVVAERNGAVGVSNSRCGTDAFQAIDDVLASRCKRRDFTILDFDVRRPSRA